MCDARTINPVINFLTLFGMSQLYEGSKPLPDKLKRVLNSQTNAMGVDHEIAIYRREAMVMVQISSTR